MKEDFIKEIAPQYEYKGDKIVLGKALLNKELVSEFEIAVPLKTINRHGLIAGATGTGKTKTLQILAEQLSLKGISTLMMDIKGDLSGLAQAGNSENPIIKERYANLGMTYTAQPFPVELMSISDEKGVKLRSTVEQFGPVLFSKILGLNDTQSSIMSIIYKYAKDKKLPLINLEDLKKLLQYVTDDPKGKEELSKDYGSIAPSSLSAILRNIVALEQEGADKFFGEPSFDQNDLVRKNKDGLGYINIIRLVDMQSKPQLFSTFILNLLDKVYSKFPEEGDSGQPKLAIIIDEAHLIFNEAPKVLLNQIETTIKLIRSKGVGIYFCTQVPGDIPEGILSQLGLKLQHALRGFTAKDKKEIDKAVQNYPTSNFYKPNELIQQLETAEALFTCLDEKGRPTPLVDLYMISPGSRMDILTDQEIDTVVNNSDLVKKYNVETESKGAASILANKTNTSNPTSDNASVENEEVKETKKKKEKEEPSFLSEMMNSPLVRDMGRTLTREASKAFMGMLGIKSKKKK